MHNLAHLAVHVAGRVDSSVNFTVSIVKGKGEGRLRLARVKERPLNPVRVVEHVPPLEVGIIGPELLEELGTGREGAVSIVWARDTINNQLGVPVV